MSSAIVLGKATLRHSDKEAQGGGSCGHCPFCAHIVWPRFAHCLAAHPIMLRPAVGTQAAVKLKSLIFVLINVIAVP